jgi:hypothetical protein
MADQDAAASLVAALKEQARLGDALTRVAGTSSEFAAFARLEEATRRVTECEQRVRTSAEPAQQ